MTSKSLRRLAADHKSLHTAGLPPNYLFAPSKEDSFADLTSLSILLAGPDSTPFVSGIYHLELNIPTTYPQTPPTAHFRTKIFHPNVDPATGAVCVETLKRDWKPDLTLRDVLITITCLLIFPNPASALNAEAGQLMEEDFKEYERKAQLWAKMHADVPAHMKASVEEARNRGEVEKLTYGKQKIGKGKRRKDDDIQVLVQEVEPENTDEHFSKIQPASTQSWVEERKSLGLGLDISMDSSAVMDIDTPTQPTKPRRRKYQFVPPAPLEESQPSAAPSFSTVFSTPTPLRTEILNLPPTSAIKVPAIKRPRAEPPTAPPPMRLASLDEQDADSQETEEKSPSWLSWADASPGTSPQETKSAKKRREISEYRRLKAAGFSIYRYNRGHFGPRRGIERL